MAAVSIPVMAKVRIGHTVEAQILQAVGVDYIDVSGTLLSFRMSIPFFNLGCFPAIQIEEKLSGFTLLSTGTL